MTAGLGGFMLRPGAQLGTSYGSSRSCYLSPWLGSSLYPAAFAPSGSPRLCARQSQYSCVIRRRRRWRALAGRDDALPAGRQATVGWMAEHLAMGANRR